MDCVNKTKTFFSLEQITSTMRKNIDYRRPKNRFTGFDFFFRFMLDTKDWSPDINVETWIANDLDFDFEKRCVMALFHGATYAGPCESMFADRFPVFTKEVVPQIVEFFQENKKRLLFSPDCKYRKIYFERFLESVGDSVEPFGTLGNYIKKSFKGTKQENYLNLRKRCIKDWFQWGRMGHWCFSEALFYFIDAPIDPPTMEFKSGRSHRDGWAFCIGRDDLVGKRKVSKEDLLELEKSATKYIKDLGRPEANFLNLETACCNYKRQHKGTRYGGCYIDEQAWELDYMRELWPEYQWMWDKYFEGRAAIIPHEMLAELHPERKSAKSAYVSTWNKCLKQYGRIPRVEAWFNNEPQVWHDLKKVKDDWVTFE
jgi:hypothetical protein